VRHDSRAHLIAPLPSLDPYVDGPLLARVFRQCSDQIACVHMSGLLSRSHMNAGQDGFRDTSSKHCYDRQRPMDQAECLVSWIDRSHHEVPHINFYPTAGEVPDPPVWRSR